MQTKSKSDLIKRHARELGFELVGIASAMPHEHIAFFDGWLRRGYDAGMTYLSRRRNDRADPRRILHDAKTMICCGLVYYGGEDRSLDSTQPQQGWISRYAWGDDYHEIVLSKLQQLEAFIRDEIAAQAQLKSYVDTGPLLERSYAASAGLGWIGKNTMLINRTHGSYFFLGEIITDLDLACDPPETDHCGNCRLCLDACPTDALEAYEMDANQCISYLTIEHRGAIASELQLRMGQHLVGCDICQEVCPWNDKIPTTKETSFRPRPGLYQPALSSFDDMTEEEFQSSFRKSAIKRVKYEGLKRNVKIAKMNAQQSKGKSS